MNRHLALAPVLLSLLCASCGAATDEDTAPGGDGNDTSSLSSQSIQRVVVVMMENHDAKQVYGSGNAPYLNSLMKTYSYASSFADVLPMSLPSEPHYVWLEAGTNTFADHSFTTDDDASVKNSTSSTAHLTALLNAHDIDWVSYQESISSDDTGNCPIASHSKYAAKHDPFVFFQDISGATPSKSAAGCVAHHKPLTALAADLKAGNLPAYTLITPNLCHDMHGAFACFSLDFEEDGDDWAKANLPAIIDNALAHRGIVLVVWDEGDHTLAPPFIVIGKHLATPGVANTTDLSLSSVTKSLQEILKVSPRQGEAFLGHAADATTNDLSSFFVKGVYP